MREFFKNLILLSSFFLYACAEKPIKETLPKQAKWESKARIKNLKENKTQNLDIDIYAIKNEKARIEVSAVLGTNVASLVMSPTDISYIIFPQKKFFSGKNSANAILGIVNLPLHPMYLSSIAFDDPLRGGGWKCQHGPDGKVSQCENVNKEIKISWYDRNKGEKNVSIVAPLFEMDWHFSAPQTDVQFKPEVFVLKQPPGFKAIQIN
jgi:hypothetical protein